MGLRRWAEARERCEAALAAGAGPRDHARARARVPRRAGGRARRTSSARWSCRTRRRTRRAPTCTSARCGACAATTRARWPRWWPASARPSASACAARSVRSCTSTPPRTCCGSGAGTRPRSGSPRPSGCELGRTTAAMRRATAGLLHALRGERRRGAARARRRRPTTGLPGEFLAPLAAARATLALAEGDARGRAGRTSTARWRGDAGSALHAAAVLARACGPRPSGRAGRAGAAARGRRAPRRRAAGGARRAARRRVARPMRARTGRSAARRARAGGRRAGAPSAGGPPRRLGTSWPSRYPAAYARLRAGGGASCATAAEPRPKRACGRGPRVADGARRPTAARTRSTALARRARLELAARPPRRRRTSRPAA